MRVRFLFDVARAFTLIEVLAVVAVVAVLAALGISAWQPLIARAEGASCLAHMRSLHASLATYVQDVGHWPQEPESDSADIDADWWIAQLKPYGATEEIWQCSTIKRAQLSIPEKDRWKIHYSPGMFGPLPSDPFKFAKQPWLVEIVGLHGHGPNVCFPDGSIRPLDDLLGKK